MQPDSSGKNLQREIIQTSREYEQWLEQQEKDGQSIESLVETVRISYGLSVVGLFGTTINDHKLTLVHFKNGQKPSFAKGVPHYVDSIVSQFRDQLIEHVKTQMEEDPWSTSTSSSPSSTGQNQKSESLESVGSPA